MGGMYATIELMDLRDISQVLGALRARLHPVDAADTLVDLLEGDLPYARKAAVLLALFAQDGETYLAFIRRSSTLRAHGADLAVPGVSHDVEDGSLVATGLRESWEECGLWPACVDVIVLP